MLLGFMPGWTARGMMGRGPALGRIVRVGVLMLAAAALSGCASADRTSKYSKRIVEEGEPVPKGGGNYKVGQPYRLNGRTYYPSEDSRYRAEGIASWYGPDFHGRETANGEVYDMHAISAAHTTMPIPSYARVTNLDNGRSIIVRVNDRGPYVGNRIIDLSIGTAKALDFYSRGLARVRVEYVGRAPLEGSDDTMLMATLRDGSPAPAPSKVMIAAAKPFIANLDDGKGAQLAPASARSFTLSSASTSVAKSTNEAASANRAKTKSVVRSASAAEAQAESAPPEETPPTAFAPMRSEAGTLDLMSGRGLY